MLNINKYAISRQLAVLILALLADKKLLQMVKVTIYIQSVYNPFTFPAQS